MLEKLDPYCDATTQSELVRSGLTTASDLTDATITRIEEVNPLVNAIIIPLFEKGRTEAREPGSGPFAGVPYAIKDLTIISKGDLNTSAIAGVKAAGYRADHDSYFVQSMRKAGFVLVGKAATPEMGTQASTESVAWGPTRNPWDLSRSVGGSSGGSAAAVAAGLVPVAGGNDAGGSVRMPASLCGVVGIKPTRGRISSGPIVADSDSLGGIAHEGIMARSVRDVAAVLDIVSGHRPGDGYWAPPPVRPFRSEVGADPGKLRVGVLLHDPAGDFTMEPECAAAARKAADVLAELGHRVSDGHPEALKTRAYLVDFMRCADVAIMREMERYSDLIGHQLGEDDMEWGTWQMVLRGRQVSARDYAAAIDAVRYNAGLIERWWEEEGWDLLVTPTVGRKQPLIGELKPLTKGGDPFVDNSLPLLAMTVPYNVSGLPAISLPLGTSSEGLPIGVQLVAAYGRDDRVLSVAAQLEQALPWARRRPSLKARSKELA